MFDRIHQRETSQLLSCNLKAACGQRIGGLSKELSYGRWSLFIVLEITHLSITLRTFVSYINQIIFTNIITYVSVFDMQLLSLIMS